RISGQVSFLGHVNDIPRFLESVDVLVHSSIRPEPMGQTVLQGLACGKPVIATAGGGPSEWIRSGENGVLVPPGEPEALAGAMRTLADSPELRARLAVAAAQTAGIHTDDECMTAHAEFFRAVRRARTEL
uniref:glycosyltransferase n=1 Tax=Frankia sp. CIT1 TaxID=2880974 RepID=UPI001EF509C2